MAIQTNDDAARLRTVLKQLRGVALSSEMPRGTLEAMAKVLTADLEVRDLAKEEREELARLASLPATDATGDSETGLWSGLSMMVRRCVELGVLSPAQELGLRTGRRRDQRIRFKQRSHIIYMICIYIYIFVYSYLHIYVYMY